MEYQEKTKKKLEKEKAVNLKKASSVYHETGALKSKPDKYIENFSLTEEEKKKENRPEEVLSWKNEYFQMATAVNRKKEFLLFAAQRKKETGTTENLEKRLEGENRFDIKGDRGNIYTNQHDKTKSAAALKIRLEDATPDRIRKEFSRARKEENIMIWERIFQKEQVDSITPYQKASEENIRLERQRNQEQQLMKRIKIAIEKSKSIFKKRGDWHFEMPIKGQAMLENISDTGNKEITYNNDMENRQLDLLENQDEENRDTIEEDKKRKKRIFFI